MKRNFVLSYDYKLPFDRLIRANRFSQGWTLSGITRFASGFPVTMIENGDNSLVGTNPNGVNNSSIDEPDFSGGPLRLNHNPRTNGNNYFDASAFSENALGTPGTAKRRFFHGPGAGQLRHGAGKEPGDYGIQVAAVPRRGVQRLQPHAVQRGRRDRRRHRELDVRQRDQRCASSHTAGRGEVQLLIVRDWFGKGRRAAVLSAAMTLWPGLWPGSGLERGSRESQKSKQ
ncbi:MAG: hypothetical protein WDM87_03705 [Terracidiphilus sp.]